jgi:hypothetical protein
MSANANVLGTSEAVRPSAKPKTVLRSEKHPETSSWNGADFAREQILGLVRRTFLAGPECKRRQIVFCPLEGHFEITNICALVAEILACETSGDVAFVEGPQAGEQSAFCPAYRLGIKTCSTAMSTNMWRVPNYAVSRAEKPNATLQWISFLAALRQEFEYCVLLGPAATSSDAFLLGQLTDGIILVLGAHSTRRAAARNIKQTLQGVQSRILGTILTDRRFPVPELLYRRL